MVVKEKIPFTNTTSLSLSLSCNLPHSCRSAGHAGAALLGVCRHPGAGPADTGQLHAGHPVQGHLQRAGRAGEGCGVHWQQGGTVQLVLSQHMTLQPLSGRHTCVQA